MLRRLSEVETRSRSYKLRRLSSPKPATQPQRGCRLVIGKGPSLSPTPAGLQVGNDYPNKALQLRNLWSRNASCAGLDQNLEYAYSFEFSYQFTNPQPDGERYFYHSDHLGSSAYITTENGYATQFLAYMPYGETLSEQQNSTSYYSPFKFSAKEKDPETGYSYFGARYYSPELSVWLSIDPLADKAPGWTPYRYGFNNPIGFVDPDGMFESKAKAKEYAENNGIRTGWFSGNKVVNNGDGTWSIENRRNHSSITDLGSGLGVRSLALVVGEQNSTPAGADGMCPNCLNPSTTRNNLLGLTYPGGNNPKSFNGQYNYSFVPTNLAEYPAIGHDRRYDNLRIAGPLGLCTDTRAIGADWRFVGEQLNIMANPFFNPIDRMAAGGLGIGLGLSALPKTVFQLSTPSGYIETMLWFDISNKGVNNAPIIHTH